MENLQTLQISTLLTSLRKPLWNLLSGLTPYIEEKQSTGSRLTRASFTHGPNFWINAQQMTTATSTHSQTILTLTM